jgi:outer membrane protein TolC
MSPTSSSGSLKVQLLDFFPMGKHRIPANYGHTGTRAGARALQLPLLLLPLLIAVGPAADAQAPVPAAAPPVITLEQAISLAEKNDPAYAASFATDRSARLDHSIGRSALLPSVLYHNQYFYTEPNGLRNQAGQTGNQQAPRFIANNAIREYASQALVSETFSAAGVYDFRRTGALANEAAADFESARRDLVLRVVSGYFGLTAADAKLVVAERGEDEAHAFLELTTKLEAGREVSHADVVKASLQFQERQREASDARLAADRARLDLATLLFPDPRASYKIADNPPPSLPARTDVDAAAAKQNPDLQSALEAVRAARDEVLAARAAYLPALSLNYTYGIDAPQFAAKGPDGSRNLGYSAFVTLDIPVWDWFATHDRIRQSEYRQQVAQVALTSVQRQLIAQLEEFYNEAKVANDQLSSLEESTRTAEESLRLTKLRYSAGEATALEVVDAQTSLTQAEAARADGALRYRVALANLQTLTGTL